MEDTNYEELFISCFFTDANKANRAMIESGFIITADMIMDKDIKNIYKSIMDMFSKGLSVTQHTVREYAKVNYNAIPFLVFADLVALGQSIAHVVDYASYILEEHKRKLLLNLCLNTAEMLKTKKNNPDKLEQEIIDTYEKISGTIQKKITIKHQSQLASEFLEKQLEFIDLEERKMGKTGYDVIDEHVLFDKGMTMFIGGRSGTGKTTFAYELVNAYAKAFQTHALFVSLEMPGVPLFRRAISTYLGEKNLRNYSKSEMRSILKSDIQRSNAVEGTIEMFEKVLVYDGCGVNMAEIEASIAIARRKYKSVDIVAVDYIGYIKSMSGKTITEQVATLARETKEIAKRNNIRVVMLSQTNRDGGTNGTSPVEMHHFKDSGAIEESADIALGIWQSIDNKDRIHGMILKNREGEKNIPFDLMRYTTHLKSVPHVAEENEYAIKEKKGFENGKRKN